MTKLIEVGQNIGDIRIDDVGFMFDGHFVNLTQKRIHYNTPIPPHKKIEKGTLYFAHRFIVDKKVEL